MSVRILFVSPGLLYSKKYPFERAGSESQIYGISKELVKMEHEVYITGRFNDFKEDDCRIIDGIKFINIITPNLKDEIIHQIPSSLIYSKLVCNKIKKINPDVISLNERFSAYFPSKLQIPKIFTTHNPDAMEFYKQFAISSNKLNYLFFDLKKKVEENVMYNSNLIITLNKNIDEYLQEMGFNRRSLIPNSVDKAKYYNSGDKNYILFAGRLNKVKGVIYLIQAFSCLSSNINMDLLIVGSGPEENSLKNSVKIKGLEKRVHFVQQVNKEKLCEYYSNCSIFVLPSVFESFGIVLIEAMASGKPVIASCIPGPSDIITHGYNGFLFEKGNVTDLKKYLELCISGKNLRDNLGKNARKTIEEKYTFEKIASQYLKVCENLLCKQKK